MSWINTLFGIPLGYLMYFCFLLVNNYGLSIILFTFFTKIVMFPLSLIAQKNSIIMVKMQPLLEDIKQWNAGDHVRINEEQRALYKREGYSTWKGILPLLVQIPIIIGLINVIYNPLQHLLHLTPDTIAPLLEQTALALGISPDSLGAGAQLRVLEAVQSNPTLFSGLAGVDPILNMDLTFLGLNLAEIPRFTS